MEFDIRADKRYLLVWVKAEIERLVRAVAANTGYRPATIRNAAILYGLAFMVSTGLIPETDQDFEKLINNLEVVVCEKAGEVCEEVEKEAVAA